MFIRKIILSYLRVINKIEPNISFLVVAKNQTHFVGFLVTVFNKEKFLLLNILSRVIILLELLF